MSLRIVEIDQARARVDMKCEACAAEIAAAVSEGLQRVWIVDRDNWEQMHAYAHQGDAIAAYDSCQAHDGEREG